MTPAEEYAAKYEGVLVPAAAGLKVLLTDHLRGVPRIDRVTARAKHPVRFSEKAVKTKNGAPKYESPLTQIQDQIAARVIVFYQEDVLRVCDVVEKYFTRIEDRDLVPEDLWKFGYFGRHMILATPMDILPAGADRRQLPRFFELQVKTLFQHAWSEANHDLSYKPPAPLTDDQQRRFAFTAAQAWGADRIFEELRSELTN